jgi:hypothetical protein
MRIATCALLVLLAGSFGFVIGGQQPAGGQKDEKQGFGALPPHPLDSAFEGVRNERQAWNAMLNNPTYLKAIREALKAKAEQEAAFRKQPNLRAGSPEQMARRAFLAVLNDEKLDEGPGVVGKPAGKPPE